MPDLTEPLATPYMPEPDDALGSLAARGHILSEPVRVSRWRRSQSFLYLYTITETEMQKLW